MSSSLSASMAPKKVSSLPMSQPHLLMPSTKAALEQQSAGGFPAASRMPLIMSRGLSKRMPHHVRKHRHWCASMGQIISSVISPSSSSSRSCQRVEASPTNLRSWRPRRSSWNVTEPFMLRSNSRTHAASMEGWLADSTRSFLIVSWDFSRAELWWLLLATLGIALSASIAVAQSSAVARFRPAAPALREEERLSGRLDEAVAGGMT
mmetsp:Transcript_69517/g.182202  ORF Transcript_69517/g.182202 Transcript_69517/m.182202 type:complete len:207 (-) Transcript_69517:139-759(-)